MYLDQREYDDHMHYAIVAEGDEDLGALCRGQIDDRENWHDNPVYIRPDDGVGIFGWMLQDNVMYCLNIRHLEDYDEVVECAQELFPNINIPDWLHPLISMGEL